MGFWLECRDFIRESRRHFHEQLQDLERAVQDMGVAAQDLFDLALQALLGHDRAICARVVAGVCTQIVGVRTGA